MIKIENCHICLQVKPITNIIHFIMSGLLHFYNFFNVKFYFQENYAKLVTKL